VTRSLESLGQTFPENSLEVAMLSKYRT